MQSNDFAKPAADSIAPHGAAERLLDAPPKTAVLQSIGPEENSELAAGTALSVAIDRVVFSAAQQTALARQSARSPVRRG
jgi:hypothetical protein